VDPLHREVLHAGRAQGAPVAHAVAEDPPGEQGVPLVLPRGAQDLPVVVGLGKSQAEGDRAHVLSGHRSPPRRHISPEAETAYLSFPALFNSVRILGFVRSALILAGGRSRRFVPPDRALFAPAREPRRPRGHRSEIRRGRSGPRRVPTEGGFESPQWPRARPVAFGAHRPTRRCFPLAGRATNGGPRPLFILGRQYSRGPRSGRKEHENRDQVKRQVLKMRSRLRTPEESVTSA